MYRFNTFAWGYGEIRAIVGGPFFSKVFESLCIFNVYLVFYILHFVVYIYANFIKKIK